MNMKALAIGFLSLVFALLVYSYGMMTFEIVLLGEFIIQPYIIFIQSFVEDQEQAFFLAYILPLFIGILLTTIGFLTRQKR